MNVASISRIRSGQACASCSCKKTLGSILGPAVIVVSFFEAVVRDHSKDHSGDRAYVSRTRSPPGSSYTTLVDSTRDEKSIVSALDPQVMVTVPEREDLRPIADEAGHRIRAALDTLTTH